MKSAIFAALFVLLSSLPALAQDSDAQLTFDIGLSSGTVNEKSYTEANVGFNYRFLDWMAWRNSIFGRFGSDIDSVYGIDTSLRGLASIGDRQMGASAFLGPGYRFVTKGDNVPFVEGGVVLSVGGISVGGGAKALFNSAVRPGAENDSQFFIILAGGGTL